MEINDKKNNWLLLPVFIGLFGLLQGKYAYHLFFMEQNQLFLSIPQYSKSLLFQPGGTARYIAEFCVQFFCIPYIGAFCTSLFLLLIAVLIFHLVRKTRQTSASTYLFEAGIVLFLLLNLLDICFYFKGITGYLLCITALFGYDLAKEHSFRIRMIWGFLLGFLVFWIASPFQGIFLIAAGSIEIRNQGINKGKSLLLPGTAGLMGYILYSYGGMSLFRIYMLPDGLCDLRITATWTKYMPWILLPVAILITPLLERLFSRLTNWYQKFVIQLCLILVFAWIFIPGNDDHESLPVKQLNYYTTHGEWDSILSFCKKDALEDELCLNFQNLALAEKGQLADSLLAYSQNGKNGLFGKWNVTIYTAPILQEICFRYGDIASSQRYAFEGNAGSLSIGFPETMKMLIRTNLIRGEYRVAAKYIWYMQHTFAYKNWANKQYAYLTDSTAMKKDPEYAGKYAYLQNKNHFVDEIDVFEMADQDKDNEKLRDYVLCSFLLDKNLEDFMGWFGYFYKKEECSKAPLIYQEAIAAFAEKRPEVLAYFPISNEVKESFEMYLSLCQSAATPEERQQWLSLNHTQSYWYYYHFKELSDEKI